MKGLKTPLERRYGVATDFISTEKRIRARRISNRGESSRTSNPAPFTKRRVRHPQKISVHFGEAEGLATRRTGHESEAKERTHPDSLALLLHGVLKLSLALFFQQVIEGLDLRVRLLLQDCLVGL
jgi:hypothetical protein